ncbi:hypothetical protein B0E54_03415 [Micromonospora sp. MH99]|nr:hypothetical protein [Micromonospora sp. MH99]
MADPEGVPTGGTAFLGADRPDGVGSDAGGVGGVSGMGGTNPVAGEPSRPVVPALDRASVSARSSRARAPMARPGSRTSPRESCDTNQAGR